ncbi:MAG: metallophosphoesterase [Proteobacteria bacterium]|nr:metallophosphoesterase [Pseudomonadota bacterium]
MPVRKIKNKIFPRRSGIAGLIALFLFLCPLFAQAELTSFAIISDTHTGSEDSVYPAFIRIVEEQNIEVIIHTGDAIHNPGRSSQWKRFLEITGPGRILHLAPGNHDIQDKRSLAVYLKFFPELYYSFSDGDTLFVMLNTEIPGEEGMIAGEQLAWLKTELERPFQYKFVFLHRSLFPIVSLHGLDQYKTARDELHQLFVQKGVSLVVSGHDHLYKRFMKEGIIYVIAAGSGGQSQFSAFTDTAYYFRYIVGTRTGKGYSFIVRDMQGGTGDEFSVTR